VKMFDAGKTRMIGLPYGEKNYDNTLSRFHTIPERNGRPDRQINGRTDRFAISISRVSMLTRDKKTLVVNHIPVITLTVTFLLRSAMPECDLAINRYMHLSIRPSVCPSHAGIDSKLMTEGSRSFDS